MGAIANLQKLIKEAEDIKAALRKAEDHYKSVQGLCGQVGYNVMVAGVSVPVAAMDSRTYQAKLIRGREMIHLGALKALDSTVDMYKKKLHDKSKEIEAEAIWLATLTGDTK